MFALCGRNRNPRGSFNRRGLLYQLISPLQRQRFPQDFWRRISELVWIGVKVGRVSSRIAFGEIHIKAYSCAGKYLILRLRPVLP
jgi:hypothetical protein